MKVPLTKKVHEYDDVYSFYFDATGVTYEAGQYTHIKVGEGPDIFGTIREMSFASAPGDPELIFSMHIGSDSRFKKKMNSLQPGDTISLFGTGGHIKLPESKTGNLVFIAGGVGMTPFRSMILEAHKSGSYDMSLVQVQRGDFLYRKELEPLVANYNAVQPDVFVDTVMRVAGENSGATFYVCGSGRLIGSVTEALARAGIAKEKIQIEKYN